MKFSTLTLIATSCLVLTALANPYRGCISLDKGLCTDCYKRKVFLNQTGCGPKLPGNDTCGVYQIQTVGNTKDNYCSVCKRGYALKQKINPGQSVGALNTTCVKGVLRHCRLEAVNPFGSHLCVACLGNRYSVPVVNSSAYICKEIANPVPNCKWGSIADAGRISCYRCNDGYAVNPRNLQCDKWSQPGCWYNNLTTGCQVCDPFEGYSIDSQGNCFKGNKVDTEEVVNKVLGKFFGGFNRE